MAPQKSCILVLLSNSLVRGLGGFLLSQAIKNAWDIASTKRVYVHTCTLDHASALSNYKARGFKVYKTEMDS